MNENVGLNSFLKSSKIYCEMRHASRPLCARSPHGQRVWEWAEGCERKKSNVKTKKKKNEKIHLINLATAAKVPSRAILFGIRRLSSTALSFCVTSFLPESRFCGEFLVCFYKPDVHYIRQNTKRVGYGNLDSRRRCRRWNKNVSIRG